MVQSFPAPRFFWVPLGPKFWNSGGKCRSPDWPQNADAHFVGACAVEMYFNISQEPLYTEIYRKNAAAQIEPRHTCENDFQVKDLPFLHTILDLTTTSPQTMGNYGYRLASSWHWLISSFGLAGDYPSWRACCFRVEATNQRNSGNWL